MIQSKQITVYVTSDGSEFQCIKLAEKYEECESLERFLNEHLDLTFSMEWSSSPRQIAKAITDRFKLEPRT